MSDKTNYITGLRNLADWLEQNEMPEGTTVNADGYSYVPTVSFFTTPENSDEIRKAIGGDWTNGASGTSVWKTTESGALGFAEITVFE